MKRTCLLLLVSGALCVTADFLMGGHLDNKNVQAPEDANPSSRLVIAKSAEEDMDLIAEESSAGVGATANPEQEPRYFSLFNELFVG